MSEVTEPQGIQVVMIGGDGEGAPAALFQAPGPWAEGQPVPHLSQTFDDPPGEASQEEWKETLTGLAAECGTAEEVTSLLLHTVGRDLYYCHSIPAQNVEYNVGEFAKRLIGEYHDDPKHE